MRMEWRAGRRGWAWLLFALLLCGTGGALAAQGATFTPLLWEVRSPTTRLFLFGTVHIGTASFYPLPASVREAFDACPAVALELDPTRMDMTAIARLMTYPPGEGLADHVPAGVFEHVLRTSPGVGLPAEVAARFRPNWLGTLLTLMVAERQGYDPAQGLDLHLAREAQARGKTLVELESFEQQAALLDSFSPELQTAMLSATLDSIDGGGAVADLTDLLQAWTRGDPAAMEAQIEHMDAQLPPALAEELNRRLLDERNEAMAQRLDGILAGPTAHFVAVGSLHLVGPNGLLQRLRRGGFELQRR